MRNYRAIRTAGVRFCVIGKPSVEPRVFCFHDVAYDNRVIEKFPLPLQPVPPFNVQVPFTVLFLNVPFRVRTFPALAPVEVTVN